jgi:hypothetical protein
MCIKISLVSDHLVDDINFSIEINAIKYFLKNCVKTLNDYYFEVDGVLTKLVIDFVRHSQISPSFYLYFKIIFVFVKSFLFKSFVMLQ